MAKSDGKQYESLVEEIYTILTTGDKHASVERNVLLDGPDGPREIDVLLRSRIAEMPLLTIVECRDHKRRLDVTAIDAFQSKIADVRANKGVIVAREGFTGTAIKKARRLGITLCTASNARETLSLIRVQRAGLDFLNTA